MGQLKDRLERIHYQLLKGRSYPDQALVLKIDSVYDAAINSSTEDLTAANLPSASMGIPLTWSADKTSISIDSGLYEINDDSLVDNTPASLGDQTNPDAFTANNEFFKVDDSILVLRQ